MAISVYGHLKPPGVESKGHSKLPRFAPAPSKRRTTHQTSNRVRVQLVPCSCRPHTGLVSCLVTGLVPTQKPTPYWFRTGLIHQPSTSPYMHLISKRSLISRCFNKAPWFAVSHVYKRRQGHGCALGSGFIFFGTRGTSRPSLGVFPCIFPAGVDDAGGRWKDQALGNGAKQLHRSQRDRAGYVHRRYRYGCVAYSGGLK